MKSAKKTIQSVVESEKALCFFGTGPDDHNLFDFLAKNSNGYIHPIRNANVVSHWTKKHLNRKYPGSWWYLLDHFSAGYSSWHELLLRKEVSDEELALCSDMMNYQGDILIVLHVSGRLDQESENREFPTTDTTLGI